LAVAIAPVETWYGGIELKRSSGRSVIVGLSGTREEIAMIRDVVQAAVRQGTESRATNSR
jgi:hypothetical protein